jgi:uridine kinase
MKKSFENLEPIFKTKIFTIVLLLKIIVAASFISLAVASKHASFIEYFINHPLSNPYEHFSTQSMTDIFPYPPLMLFITALPFAIFAGINNAGTGSLDILLLKIPILIADVILFYFLIKFFNKNQKSILYLYWCSPILFYVNYINATPDIIPITFLIASLYFLLGKKDIILSAILLGLSIATKTGILLIVPFYIIYLWKKNKNIEQVIMFSCIFSLVELIAILPYVFSKGFWNVAVFSSSQVHLPSLNLEVQQGIIFYIPLAIFGYLMYKGMAFRKITKDILFMLIGISFILIVTAAMPDPAKYVWCVPFIVYLLIRENVKMWMYAVFNIFYFLYFIASDPGFFLSFQSIHSQQLANQINTKSQIFGLIHSDMIVSITYTCLVSILLYMSYLIWKEIIRRSLIFQQTRGIPAIGISGDSGSGKTSLANALSKLFTRKNTTIICGDDIHKWERGNENWQKYTHLNPLSNHVYHNYKQINDLKMGKAIYRPNYDHDTGKFTTPQKIRAKEYIISEGLHTFFIQQSNSLYELKVYLKPNENLRRHWKIIRDTSKRKQDIEKVLEHLKRREGDAGKFIYPQEDYSDVVVRYEALTELSNKHLTQKKNLPLRLVVDISVDIDMGSFYNAVEKIANGVTVTLFYPNHRFQRMEFDGKISKEDVARLIAATVPEFDEYGVKKENILEGYDGLLQAICLYCLDAKLKMLSAGE